MARGTDATRGMPGSLRVVLALGVPLVAAMAVVGTYLGHEIVVFAGLLTLSMVGFLFVRPVLGVAFLTGAYMLAAYPTALHALGVLSLINLLGVCLLILLLAQILAERDVGIVFAPPVLVLLGIGLVFLLSTLYSDVLYPGLEISRATGRTGYRIIDRTEIMTENFITRLAFLVFVVAFVRTRGDVRMIFYAFVGALLIAVPSALMNWGSGELARGFRVSASITAGANANRLGLICWIQIICWWYWFRAQPTPSRRWWALGTIAASAIVVSGTGSRSALVLGMVTFVLLLIGRPRYRVSVGAGLAGVLAFVVVLLTVAPPQAVTRMLAFFPETRDVAGASSIELRETTVSTGNRIIRDHPFTGIGLGNFREVARQIYSDRYFRPPHNSFLWAAAEGGVFVVLGYGILFWMTWRNLGRGIDLSHHDPETAALGMAMRRVFVVFLVSSSFADMWLSPLLYVQVGFAYVFRRYMESHVPRQARAIATAPALAREAA